MSTQWVSLCSEKYPFSTIQPYRCTGVWWYSYSVHTNGLSAADIGSMNYLIFCEVWPLCRTIRMRFLRKSYLHLEEFAILDLKNFHKKFFLPIDFKLLETHRKMKISLKNFSHIFQEIFIFLCDSSYLESISEIQFFFENFLSPESLILPNWDRIFSKTHPYRCTRCWAWPPCIEGYLPFEYSIGRHEGSFVKSEFYSQK